MNKEYKRTLNGVMIEENGHLVEKDNHSDVVRELELENEIEMLERELSEAETRLSECNNKNLFILLTRYFIVDVLFYLLMYWRLDGDVILYNPRFNENLNFVLYLIFVFNALSLPFVIPAIKAKNPFKVSKEREELKLKVEYLRRSLEKCKSELNEIKMNKDKEHVSLDEEIVSLTEYNKSYRESLERKLELLAKIKKVKQHIADGTLTQYMKENFEADEIEFVKEYVESESRKRVK